MTRSLNFFIKILFVKIGRTHLDRLVVLVGLNLLSKLFDDDVVGVDFQVLLGGHVTRSAGVRGGTEEARLTPWWRYP